MRIRVGNFLSDDLPELELVAGVGAALAGVEQNLGSAVTIAVTGTTSVGPEVATFAKSGGLAVAVGTGRFLMPGAGTVVGVAAAINTAPTGSSVICDLNKNGVTMFTTQGFRPTIAASAFKTTTTAVPDITAFTTGDYLTVDVDQVGSSVAGSDLIVQVFYNLGAS